jgi:hypothetical protein
MGSPNVLEIFYMSQNWQKNLLLINQLIEQNKWNKIAQYLVAECSAKIKRNDLWH